ncbi:carbohydrate sulfotransferase 11-like [Babylonia areolata]|uniref:carbohydrate sulfotransferase 11-like n=1 Tax=Babylonia areolata TaxID=304850 RepID=UPI003FD1FC74
MPWLSPCLRVGKVRRMLIGRRDPTWYLVVVCFVVYLWVNIKRESLAALSQQTPSNSSRQLITEESWKLTQKLRQRQMQEYCEAAKRSRVFRFLEPFTYSRYIVLPENDLLYCPVEKSASTFMRRFLYSLTQAKGSSTVMSPFNVPIHTALKFDFRSLREPRVGSLGRFLLWRPKVRVVISREPFSRLFSAWVDKLLVPNSFYWAAWGAPIVKRRHSSPSPRSLQCGHDVTFPEFVDYVIKHLHARDAHVTPVSQLCSPCAVNYTFLGHLETFTSDFHHLASGLNVTIANNFSSDVMATQLSHDAIKDSAISAFQFYERLRPCVSKFDMCQRLWQKLQLRGIINDDIDFPLTPHEATMTTYSEFSQLLTEARRRSNDSRKLRGQKIQALKSAFAEVPPAAISKLLEIYQADFEMFGYEKYPSFISRTTL